jgi:hypothetical protein
MLFTKTGGIRTMKKIICITILFIILAIWCDISATSEDWQKGIITEVTETTIIIDGKTYYIDSNTVIKDEHDNTLSIKALGQETCCNSIRFLIRNNRYIEKIIVETSKAVM